MADALEEHVTCSICLGLYDDPLALPCMHSFCRRCLQGIVASSMCLKCPECRKDIKLGKNGVAGLAKNFQLGCIVASYKENMNNTHDTRQSNSRLPPCTVHRAPCPLECKKCRIPVCIQCVCSDQHATHLFSIIDDNDDIADRQSDIYCDKHARQYRLYCKTCQFLVCLKCVTSRDHTKHLYSAIDSAYEQQRMLLDSRLKEFEKQQQVTRTNWKTYRDFAQKTQSDAQSKRDQLTNYFSRLKDSLDRKEQEMRTELDTREKRVLEECKRKIASFQNSEKDINNAAQKIKQLLTEERLQLLNGNTNSFDRVLNNDSMSKPSFIPSAFEDASLVACQFEKEIKTIRWDWPKQVPERLENIEPTAPPVDTTIQPVPRPRRRQSQNDRQYYQSQQYYQQRQHNQQQQAVSNDLEIGTLVQRGKHWKASMEDGGPGHLGTVVQTTVDPHVYMVRWPNGNNGSYIYNPQWKEEIVPP